MEFHAVRKIDLKKPNIPGENPDGEEGIPLQRNEEEPIPPKVGAVEAHRLRLVRQAMGIFFTVVPRSSIFGSSFFSTIGLPTLTATKNLGRNPWQKCGNRFLLGNRPRLEIAKG